MYEHLIVVAVAAAAVVVDIVGAYQVEGELLVEYSGSQVTVANK